MARQDFLDASAVISKLNEEFSKHKGIIDDNANAIKKLQAEYSKLPSDYLKIQREIQAVLKAQAMTEKELTRVKQETSKAEILATRAAEARRKATEAQSKSLDAQAKAEERANNRLQAATALYNKTQQKLNVLSQEYKNLAVRKELIGKLTAEESKRYDFLSTKIKKYDSALKAVDASMGKYGRNVGNYASGFNPLGNSINQLTREMPAFANSMQTGFMAISNNLPIFFDSIQQVIVQNKELQAQGLPTQNVLKQIAGSVLSLGTALSVGVTLLTVYGDDIVEWGSNLFKTEKVLSDVEKTTIRYNETMKSVNDTSARIASEELNRSQTLFAIAKNTTLSYEQRKNAVETLQRVYPKYLANLTDEQILAGDTAEAEKALTVALLGRATAMAASDLLQENIKKTLTVQKQLTLELSKLEKERIALAGKQKYSRDLEEQARLNKDVNESLVQVNASERLAEIRAKERTAALSEERKILFDLFNGNAQYLDIVKDDTIVKGKNAKATDDYIQAQTNSKVAFERTISSLEERLGLVSKENALYGILKTQLDLVKDAYQAMYGEQEKANEETEKTIKFGTEEYYNDVINRLKAEQTAVADNTEEYALYNRMIQSVQDQLDTLTGKSEDVDKLSDALERFKMGFVTSLTGEMGLDSLNTFIDGTFKNLMDQTQLIQDEAKRMQMQFQISFLAISEVAQQAFAFMQQNSQAYFQSQYADLERQKEISLQYAGESVEAREEIERQYEERKKEIRRRELKAQKEQALFNAIINTAQAVVAALPNIPLSILVGALGAAQIAMIASRPVPAYAEGIYGDESHPGGTMLVNDGRHREVIQTPDGRIMRPTGKNVLMNAPKGTQVFPNENVFQEELNRLLQSNNIAPFADTLHRNMLGNMVVNTGGGLTKDDLDSVMAKYTNKSSFHVNIDEDGIHKYLDKSGNKTRFKDSRISTRGNIF